MQNEGEHRAFLSTEIAGRREVRFAVAAVVASVVFLLATLPFATEQLPGVPAFISAYESALVICYLITTVLLFNQFNVLRSPPLCVLASGYLFAALIVFAHMLTFPGVFSSTGLLGAGTQSSVWLYVFWHAGFPLFVVLYALLDRDGGDAVAGRRASMLRRGEPGISILIGAAAILAIVCGLTFVATAMGDFLPVLLLNKSPTSVLTVVGWGFWIPSLFALCLLWRRRPNTVLDFWLMVVMGAWLFEVALFVLLNTSRFALGWYVARIYGLVAASSLLIVLLIETGTHNAQLAQLSAKLSAANRILKQLSLTDALTNLSNRRFFDTYLADQVALAQRHKRTLALVLCDIDAFKAYNDHHGHQAGDECLKQIATALQSCCRRPADMAARYGGEEFALVLPETDLAAAAQIAEAARDAVAQLQIPHPQSPAGPYVSISGGVAALSRNVDMTAPQLIAAADRTLYQAKQRGRNRMVSVQAEAA